MTSDDVFEELIRLRRGGVRTVLATVVAARGSTPRSAGARMLVRRDGSIVGTVGGGPREAEVIEAARELFRKGGSRLVSVDFQEGLAGGDGPICGGSLEVFMEAIDAPRRVVIAGAGHVGLALHRIVSVLGWRTVVLDHRPEFANGDRFPAAEVVVGDFETVLSRIRVGPGDGIVILTPEHRWDEAVLRQALATEAAYVGMIGSRKKVPAVLDRLRRDGFDEPALARVRAPVGLAIGAETPEEIAVAIAAEMIETFRGGDGDRPVR